MEYDSQLKLQSFLDGELSEAEAREVASWLARDQEAVLLLAELRNTREACAKSEGIVLLPESREFFWSKIEREISRLEQPAVPRERPSLLALWRRFLVPASAIAALVIITIIAVGPLKTSSMPISEAENTDNGAFVYRDDATQTTLVWLSYPAENDVVESGTADRVQ